MKHGLFAVALAIGAAALAHGQTHAAAPAENHSASERAVAQSTSPPRSASLSQRTVPNQIAFLRCGGFFGRSGVALGPSITCENNVFDWLGAYWFVGLSRIRGYETQGVTASAADQSAGGGIVFRPFRVNRFRFGGFVQAGYTGSHTRASYVDSDSGYPVEYRDSDKNPTITAGANVEYQIPHGPSIVVRAGKNFGDSLAATTDAGISAGAGVLFDPIGLGKRVGNVFK